MFDVTTATAVAQMAYSVLITTVTATGSIKIIGINIYALAALVIPAIHVLVAFIKNKFPNLEKKAWMAPTLGVIIFLAVGVLTGQITSLVTLATYIATGLMTGGLSANIRDMWAGK